MRKYLIAGGLTLTLVAAALGGTAAWFLYLPHPNDSTRDQLFAWLVLRDLASQTPEIRQSLVDRFEAEILKGIDLSEVGVSLSPAQQQTVAANVEVLKYDWFVSSVDRYANVKEADKVEYLGEKIKVIEAFTTLNVGDPDAAGEEADSFFDDIGGWIVDAPAEQSDRMAAAVIDGVTAWLALSDLRDTPYEVRKQLAIRIIAELEAGMRLDEILLELNEPQMKQLIANSELLLQVWIYMSAKEYGPLDSDARTKYVNGKLDDIAQWGVMEALANPDGSAPTPSQQFAAITRLTALMKEWINDAPTDNQPHVEAFVSHLGRNMIWRQINGD